jgi:hypothetical protein
MPKGPEFSTMMDKLLKASKVPEGTVGKAIHSIAVSEHDPDPMNTRLYSINLYWRSVTDAQRETGRTRRLRGDLRSD